MLFITCRLPDNTCAKAPHAQNLLDVNNEQAATLLKHDGAGGTSISTCPYNRTTKLFGTKRELPRRSLKVMYYEY